MFSRKTIKTNYNQQSIKLSQNLADRSLKFTYRVLSDFNVSVA